MKDNLTLYGFNNLTKSLSFNIYDICITETEEERKQYIEYIDEVYNTERLTQILIQVTRNIGAHILNISKQDYVPQGASVNVLISEEEVPVYEIDTTCNKGLLSRQNETVLAHLDKSHITVHTYPESHPEMGISTFRADIDVATCGEISPLKSLNDLIQSFDSDIITIDYKVRGFTRMSNGTKVFVDHDFDSIQDYIDPSLLRNYNAFDVNVNQHNMFHTRMMIRDINLNNYLFGKTMADLSVDKTQYLENTLVREMKEIYFGQTLYQ